MKKAKKSEDKKTPSRITRSISFETPNLSHVQAQAKLQRRSPNWYVNELIRKDLENPSAL